MYLIHKKKLDWWLASLDHTAAVSYDSYVRLGSERNDEYPVL